MASSVNPSVLTYHNVTLHQREVDIINNRGWLNDTLIQFYFDYLTHEVFANHPEILFFDPSAMFLVSFSDDLTELEEALAPLKLHTRTLILIPINDNENIERAGGSHWSLLVYNRNTNTFTYYDSYSNDNLQQAKVASKKLFPLLGMSGGAPEVMAMPAPQQHNGYDCGVYTLSFAEYLAHAFVDPSKVPPLNVAITPETIAAKRKFISELITRLRLEKTGGVFSLSKRKKQKQQETTP